MVSYLWSRPVLLLILLAIIVCNAHTQTIYGGLTGTVLDPTGIPIQNASVTIRSVETGVVISISTNDHGLYTANTLVPGVYTVSINVSGFSPVRVTGVVVAVNATRQLDETLSLASTSDQVVVTAASPALQTERADVSYEISTEMMENLPTTSTTGRNFQSLYQLVPGATPPAEQNSASGNPQRSQATNVNGTPNIANSTKIDGAINTYPWVPFDKEEDCVKG
ncbi:carboxypeptidase-like regulatory domain-containing protein [Terriglobus albidus]|nr:carboxypeptidase-like regulatory domain-containing protein [Terriglobus albidus]